MRWKVYDKTYDVQVTGVTDRRIYGLHDGVEYSMLLTQIYPIPITAEILEKNGLFRHEGDADNPQRIALSNHFVMARTYTDVDWWRVLIYDEESPSEELFNGIIDERPRVLRVGGAHASRAEACRRDSEI